MLETTDTGQCQQCSSLLRWVADYYADLPDIASKVGPETTFVELGFDSLDYVDWILEAELVFEVIIPDREAERLRTVGEFIRRLKIAGASWGPDRQVIIRKGRFGIHRFEVTGE